MKDWNIRVNLEQLYLGQPFKHNPKGKNTFVKLGKSKINSNFFEVLSAQNNGIGHYPKGQIVYIKELI